MKKIAHLFLFLSIVATAQKLSDKINNTSNQVDKTAKSVENASNTAGKILSFGKSLFAGKKRIKENENISETPQKNNLSSSSKDNCTITIKGVDYENPSFGQIFTKVKTHKGVSLAQKFMDQDETSITFDFKGNVSEIWDGLDEKTKRNFKVLKLTKNEMLISFKN